MVALVLLHLYVCVCTAHHMQPACICKSGQCSVCCIRLFSLLAKSGRLCVGPQGSTAGVDPRIRKVEEDISGVQQAQLKCEQDVERLMQDKRLSKPDTALLSLRLKQREELVEELKQLREEELLLHHLYR